MMTCTVLPYAPWVTHRAVAYSSTTAIPRPPPASSPPWSAGRSSESVTARWTYRAVTRIWTPIGYVSSGHSDRHAAAVRIALVTRSLMTRLISYASNGCPATAVPANFRAAATYSGRAQIASHDDRPGTPGETARSASNAESGVTGTDLPDRNGVYIVSEAYELIMAARTAPAATAGSASQARKHRYVSRR